MESRHGLAGRKNFYVSLNLLCSKHEDQNVETLVHSLKCFIEHTGCILWSISGGMELPERGHNGVKSNVLFYIISASHTLWDFNTCFVEELLRCLG